MNRSQNDSREADFPESRTPWRNSVHTERANEKAGENAGEKTNCESRIRGTRASNQILNYAHGTTAATPGVTVALDDSNLDGSNEEPQPGAPSTARLLEVMRRLLEPMVTRA
jgi:hypothetical protein